MVIYADVFLVQCFVFDFVILYIISLLIKKSSLLRLIFTAAGGAVYSFTMLVLQPPCVPLINIAVLCCAVAAAFGRGAADVFIKRVVMLWALQLLVSGVCLFAGVYSEKYIESFGRLYPVMTDGVFIILVLCAIGVASAVHIILTRKKRIFRVYIKSGNVVKEVYAYYDSGNMLTYSGLPVIIVDETLAQELGAEMVLSIQYKSISGEDIIPGFFIDALSTHEGGLKEEHIPAAVAPHPLSVKGDFSVLLNRSMIIE